MIYLFTDNKRLSLAVSDSKDTFYVEFCEFDTNQLSDQLFFFSIGQLWLSGLVTCAILSGVADFILNFCICYWNGNDACGTNTKFFMNCSIFWHLYYHKKKGLIHRFMWYCRIFIKISLHENYSNNGHVLKKRILYTSANVVWRVPWDSLGETDFCYIGVQNNCKGNYTFF